MGRGLGLAGACWPGTGVWGVLCGGLLVDGVGVEAYRGGSVDRRAACWVVGKWLKQIHRMGVLAASVDD